MSENEKKPYRILHEKSKKEFKKSIQIINHYLFKDYNGVVHMAPNSFQIFMNEKILEGFEKDLDPKEVREEAYIEWRKMDPKKKKIYLEKKKDK